MEMLMRDVELRKAEFVTVFQQALSPCGRYLAAGDSYGRVSLFQLAAAVAANTIVESRRPIVTFQAFDNSPVYTLITAADEFLVTGGVGPVKGWSWKELIRKCKEHAPGAAAAIAPTLLWSLPLTSKPSVFDEAEANCLCFDDRDNVLYAACGNDLIQRWNLETGAPLNDSLSGHTDYVQWICLNKTASFGLASASEDGTAKVWDLRSPSAAIKSFCPSSKKEAVRNEFGNWLSCVDVDMSGQWLVCGGGPSLTLWHISSGEMTCVLDTPSATHNYISAQDGSGEVVAGASDGRLHHFGFNGAPVKQVQVNMRNVFHFHTTDKLTRLTTACGDSPDIDVFTSPGYVAFTLSTRSPATASAAAVALS